MKRPRLGQPQGPTINKQHPESPALERPVVKIGSRMVVL